MMLQKFVSGACRRCFRLCRSIRFFSAPSPCILTPICVYSLRVFLICFFIGVSRRALYRASGMSTASGAPVKTTDWFLFPRENESNNYAVNWSLAEDGVTNASEAYRNARTPILTNRLSSKVEKGTATLKAPAYTGAYAVKEAGDTLSHADFHTALANVQQHFSSGVTLFVEDACLGAHNKARIGVRVITDQPAVALVCRALMVSTNTQYTCARVQRAAQQHDLCQGRPSLII
jgi:hypothetical protein